MKKRILLVVLCVAMVAMGGFATWAYLTSQDSATNTFTVGDVEIMLDETDYDQDIDKSDATTEGRDKHNKYHLQPGVSYVKDPTVHVKDGSENCYVRMIVTVKNIDKLEAAIPANENADYYMGEMFLLQKMCGGWDGADWACVDYDKVGNDGIYEFRYKEVVSKTAATEGVVTYTSLTPLFESIMVPGFVDNDNLALLKTVEVNVVAHAIQAAGFVDAAEAWTHWQ